MSTLEENIKEFALKAGAGLVGLAFSARGDLVVASSGSVYAFPASGGS